MKELENALEDMKRLHQQVLGRPAPDLTPDACVPFPFGVDPIQHALELARRMKEGFERTTAAPTANWTPIADCWANQDEFIVRLEVPGVSREDLKVFVEGGECIVRGERKEPQPLGECRPLSIERPWGRFERRFVVPAACRADEMKARVFDGILELRIPIVTAEKTEKREVVVS